MRVTRHKRQIFLFLAAILAPAGVLIGLAGRLIYEDRELATKRAADQRRAAVDQLRRELSSRLEAIKLQEINRLMRPPDSSGARGSENPAMVFIASLENDRLVLPWEAGTASDQPVSQEFAQHRQAGEAQEFIQKNYAAAAEAYRLALASARRAGERGEARRDWRWREHWSRREAPTMHPAYRLLLNDTAEARDEQGVSFRIYAAERLPAAGRDSDTVRNFLVRSSKSRARYPPAGLALIDDGFQILGPGTLVAAPSHGERLREYAAGARRIAAGAHQDRAWGGV